MGMGDQFETLIKESVEEVIGEHDFSDAINSELPDFDEKIGDAIRDNEDIKDMVREEVKDQVSDLHIRDEVDEEVQNALPDAVREYMESEEGERYIRKILAKCFGDIIMGSVPMAEVTDSQAKVA